MGCENTKKYQWDRDTRTQGQEHHHHHPDGIPELEGIQRDPEGSTRNFRLGGSGDAQSQAGFDLAGFFPTPMIPRFWDFQSSHGSGSRKQIKCEN